MNGIMDFLFPTSPMTPGIAPMPRPEVLEQGRRQMGMLGQQPGLTGQIPGMFTGQTAFQQAAQEATKRTEDIAKTTGALDAATSGMDPMQTLALLQGMQGLFSDTQPQPISMVQQRAIPGFQYTPRNLYQGLI